MEMILLKLDGNEWNYAWGWLADHPLNKDLDNPMIALNQGEAWQYMGSSTNGEKVIHQMRHRCHPKFNRIEYLSVEASPNMCEDDIARKIPVK